VQTVEQAVLDYIRKHKLLEAGDRVGLAVSGGADSVALLRLLLRLRRELGVVLAVVHFNHQLRGAESDADERFVADLAARHSLELHSASGEVATYAAEKHLSVETAAREMRYIYFRRLLRESPLDRIATAHTLDDQAETVLLRLVRGAGTRGLAGIYPQLRVPGSRSPEKSMAHSGVRAQREASIIRPLLGTRRRDLEAYLKAMAQDWREDSSNRDLRHGRNRVRHGILPRLERHLNPAVREALAETAELARVEEDYWAQEVARVLPQVSDRAGSARPPAAGTSLRLAGLMALPLAFERRVVRAAAESLGLRLEFRHVEEILAVGAGSVTSANLPDGWVVSRSQHGLRFERAGPKPEAPDYEYRLPLPGRILVPEAGMWLEAVRVPAGAGAGYNPDHLLDAAMVSNELRVRNWRAGDRFWPAHTKAPRKIKELLEQRHLRGAERKLWPVVVSQVVTQEEVVWVRGFPASERLRPRDDGQAALVIRESEA
jgi:tRNA(Ile)-lysidine synthase